MKVLVVGGAGYIGSQLVQDLVYKGHEVKVVDRDYFGFMGLKAVANRIKIITGDVRSPKKEWFKDVNAVINLAALSNDPTAEHQPEATRSINTDGAFKLAKMAREIGVFHYIFASTCSVYDTGDLEGNDKLQNEDDKVWPPSTYGKSKIDAERYLHSISRADFRVTCLRKGTVFGWSPKPRIDLVVNQMVRDAIATGEIQVHNGGEIWRPMVHVRDVSRAYIATLTGPQENNFEVYNVVLGNFRVSELALRIYKKLGEMGINVKLNPSYNLNVVRNYRVTGSKITKHLGFYPVHSIEWGVEELANMMRKMTKRELYDPRMNNMDWMLMLEEVKDKVKAGVY